MRILFLLLCASFLNGCSSSQTDEVGDLQINLIRLETIFNDIELSAFDIACGGYEENMDLIKKRCMDSVSSIFVSSVNRYKTIKKSKEEFILNYKLLSKNIQLEKSQLKWFKQDIDNQLIPLDSISFFIEMEQQNIYKISDQTNNVASMFDEIISIHDELYPKIKILAKNNCY